MKTLEVFTDERLKLIDGSSGEYTDMEIDATLALAIGRICKWIQTTKHPQVDLYRGTSGKWWAETRDGTFDGQSPEAVLVTLGEAIAKGDVK